MVPAMAANADRAIFYYRMSMFIGDGGIGFFRLRQVEADLAIATLLSEKLEFEAAERQLRASRRREGDSDRIVASLMWVLEAQGRRAEAMDMGVAALQEHIGYVETLESYKQLAIRDNAGEKLEQVLRDVIKRDGLSDVMARDLMLVMYLSNRFLEALDYGESVLLANADLPHTLELFHRIAAGMDQMKRVIEICRRRLEVFPDHLHTLRMLSILLLEEGEVAESVVLTRRTIELDPTNPSARYFLAMGRKVSRYTPRPGSAEFFRA
jgi:tetratricopeptide (TPR) repeat protein